MGRNTEPARGFGALARDSLCDGGADGGAGALSGDGVDGLEVEVAAAFHVLDPVRVAARFGTEQAAAFAAALAASRHQQHATGEVGGSLLRFGGLERGRKGRRSRCDFETVQPDVRGLPAESADEDGKLFARPGVAAGRVRFRGSLQRLVDDEPVGQVQEFERDGPPAPESSQPAACEPPLCFVAGDLRRDRRRRLRLLIQRFPVRFVRPRLP